MNTIESLFGLPALVVAVVVVARIVGRMATPSGAGLRIRRPAASRPSVETDLSLPTLSELVLDPRYRFYPINVWYDHTEQQDGWDSCTSRIGYGHDD